MATTRRWQAAQVYEKSHWQRLGNQIAAASADQLDWYGWKASEMEKRLAGFFTEQQKESARVLEVGSGPIGIVSFLQWGSRYTIDPLEHYYRTNTTLTRLRDPNVRYNQGLGEKLPFDDEFFSLVVLDNVLDHVQRAHIVLREIYRVLTKDGVLYLTVNVHTLWGGLFHVVLSKLKIDKGHPYTFTPNSIKKFLERHQFLVQLEQIDSYYQAREKDRGSSSLKDQLKGYTGLSEFLYYSVCSKRT